MIGTFGSRLRQLRAERGLSQDDFAKLLGTSKQVISRYETNQRSPKVSVVNDYAHMLGVPLGYLLDGVTEKESSISSSEVESSFDDDPVYQDLKRLIKEAKEKKTAFVIGYGGAGDVMPVDEEEYQSLKAYLEVRRASKKRDK